MSTIRTNTLSNVAGTQSTAIENAINGSAKAWVNFNGTGTVAIRRSYNVSSITDNGVGLYEVNLTNPMSNTTYSVIGCGSIAPNNFPFCGAGIVTSSKAYMSTYASTTFADTDNVYVAIFS